MQPGLRGEILGDASAGLSMMEMLHPPGRTLVVDCAGLLRVDFAAAGSILNWASARARPGLAGAVQPGASPGRRVFQHRRYPRICHRGAPPRLNTMEAFHGTTIISVRRKTPQGDQVAIGGDGQATLGSIIVKGSAQSAQASPRARCWRGSPVRRPTHSPCLSALRPSSKSTKAIWPRAAIELTKDWRTDRVLRRLEAMLAVADHQASPHHHGQRRRAGARNTASSPSARAAPTPRRQRSPCSSTAALGAPEIVEKRTGNCRCPVHLHQHAAHH